MTNELHLTAQHSHVCNHIKESDLMFRNPESLNAYSCSEGHNVPRYVIGEGSYHHGDDSADTMAVVVT